MDTSIVTWGMSKKASCSMTLFENRSAVFSRAPVRRAAARQRPVPPRPGHAGGVPAARPRSRCRRVPAVPAPHTPARRGFPARTCFTRRRMRSSRASTRSSSAGSNSRRTGDPAARPRSPPVRTARFPPVWTGPPPPPYTARLPIATTRPPRDERGRPTCPRPPIGPLLPPPALPRRPPHGDRSGGGLQLLLFPAVSSAASISSI